MTVNEILTDALEGKHIKLIVNGEDDRELTVHAVVVDIDGSLVLYDTEGSFVRVALAAVQAFEVVKGKVVKVETKAEVKDGPKRSGK